MIRERITELIQRENLDKDLEVRGQGSGVREQRSGVRGQGWN